MLIPLGVPSSCMRILEKNKNAGKGIIPNHEDLRLQALHYYNILNDLPDKFFTNLAHIIAETFSTPIALVTLVSELSVIFKGNVGMPGIQEMDRDISLCSLAILQPEPTIFNDTLKEPCLLSNPLVAGSFGLRFYAGAPMITPEGFNIGTICIVDKEPRDFSELEKELLVRFAENAMHEIVVRKSLQVYASPLLA